MVCTKCKKTVRVIAKFLDDQLTNALEIAHEITNEVAKVIGNPLFQLLVSQLPAGVKTKEILNVVSKVLTKTSGITDCKDLKDIERINCILNQLNLLPVEERNSALLRLKSALTAHLDGNRYEGFVYDTAGQLDYFKTKVEAGAKIEVNSDYVAPEIPDVAGDISNEPAPTLFTHAMPISERPQETPPAPRAF